jgi:hypothetical protein
MPEASVDFADKLGVDNHDLVRGKGALRLGDDNELNRDN